MFDIEYADDVVILAETLSFSETAQRLCLSRSAVSRHVDAVEKGPRVSRLWTPATLARAKMRLLPRW